MRNGKHRRGYPGQSRNDGIQDCWFGSFGDAHRDTLRLSDLRG